VLFQIHRMATTHLVVLQHGLAGTGAEMSNIADSLDRAFPGQLRIVLSEVNEWSTLDGVAAGGDRLASLVKETFSGGALSFVGHSLGGLYARRALRTLEAEGWFTHSGAEAANFITTSCPHLGVLSLGAVARFGGGVLGLVGATFADIAHWSDALKELSDGVAVRALQRFHRRAIYGNYNDDLAVHVCSSLILPHAPNLPTLAPGLPERVSPPAPPREAGADGFGEMECVVQEIAEQLCTLSWERYVVQFPSGWWPGTAHSKICNHSLEDPENCGKEVVSHICDGFVDHQGCWLS